MRGERLDPQVLRPVRVLVLVDMEVAPAILVALEDLGRGLEQANRGEQQVIEVECAGALQAFLVARRQAGDCDATAGDRDEVVDRGRVDHLVLGAADPAEDRRGPRGTLGLDVLLAEDLLHQRLLVVRVVNDEVPAHANRLAVPAQDPGAQGVERARLDVLAGRLADERDDPLAELARGAVREGHRQDLPRPDALDAHEPRDAMGEHAGLARTRAGEDQEGPVGCRDGASLLGVQVGGDPLGESGGRGLALGS